MYRLIVAARIRHIFARLDVGDSETMVRSLAPGFVYRFYGDHALGGERRTLAAMRAWWGRLFRLPPDGTRYENVVDQFVRLRWGRVTEVRTLEDTQEPARALQTLVAAGIEEAPAAPITDGLWQGEAA